VGAASNVDQSRCDLATAPGSPKRRIEKLVCGWFIGELRLDRLPECPAAACKER
jgi:hypothetical protein